MDLNGKRVLLTGASGGLGQPLARLLSGQGANLILVGRSAESLDKLKQELATGQVETVVGDITDGSFREQLAAQQVEAGGLDLLVNLAGINTYRNFEAEDPQQLELMFQTNLIAPVLLTRAL